MKTKNHYDIKDPARAALGALIWSRLWTLHNANETARRYPDTFGQDARSVAYSVKTDLSIAASYCGWPMVRLIVKTEWACIAKRKAALYPTNTQ